MGLRISFATVGLVVSATSRAGAHGAEAVGDSIPALWNPEAWVVVSLALGAGAYALGARRLLARSARTTTHRYRMMAFVGGWLALALALASPIDTLGAYSFSVHMVQHVVLMLVAAPLLVLARPGPVFAWALPRAVRKGATAPIAALRRVWRCLTQPLVAWTVYGVTLWAWHAPSWFAASLAHDGVHALQHMNFLVAALAFWWSLLRSATDRGFAVLSAFTTSVHASVLGAVFALAPRVLYPHYRATPVPWPLSALQDQQLGGFIMWMPAGLAYLAAGMWLVASLVDTRTRNSTAVARSR